jgi:branched-subunit amino acid transport protein
VTLLPILLLAAGTFAFRYGGVVLRDRISFSERSKQLLSTSAVILLTALVATAALAKGKDFAGLALPAGVLVAGLLAWRRAPFVVVVVAAALTTALLRLAGLP